MAASSSMVPVVGTMGEALVAAMSDSPESNKRPRKDDANNEAKEKLILDEVLAAVKDQGLSANIRQKLRVVIEEFGRKTQKLLKLTDKSELAGQQITEISDGRWPAGVKPFKLQYDSPALDVVVPEATIRDYIYSTKIPMGSSVRAAKKVLHQSYVSINKQLDKHVMDTQITDLKSELTYDNFIGHCVAGGTEAEAHVGALGLDLPPGLFEPVEKVTRVAATALYKKLLESIAQRQAEAKAEKAKKEKENEKKIERLTALTPSEVFDQAVQQAMRKKLQKDKNVDFGKLNAGAAPAECVQQGENKDDNVKGENKKARKKTKSEINAAKESKGSKNEEGQGGTARRNQPSQAQPPKPGKGKGKAKGQKGGGKEGSSGKGGKSKGKGKHKN